jgi:acyl-coenzyme A thioesterase PaaI-like protein
MSHKESAGNTRRRGPFWDGVEGRAPLPPAAATLGLEVVRADGDAGVVELAFTATEAFTNPFGEVLGAFLAAMLYDTVGPALLATLGPDQVQARTFPPAETASRRSTPSKTPSPRLPSLAKARSW